MPETVSTVTSLAEVRALVTGAAGFIGSRLVRALAAGGDECTGVDALTPYYDPELKRRRFDELARLPGVDMIAADLTAVDLDPMLDGCDTVFHFAAQPGVRASWTGFEDYVRDNVVATQRLLGAADPELVRRFVFASSSSVYGQITGAVDESAPTRPYSPYGVTKLAAEALCGAYALNFGLRTVSLRLFTVYGPDQRPDMAMYRLIGASLLGQPFPMFGDGSQVRSFTFVDDVVEAALATSDREIGPGTILNVSGGSTSSLGDVIETIEEITGQPVPIERRDSEAGDVTRTDGIIEKAGRVLGWTPRTSLREGLTRQVEWMRAHLDAATASR
jgi:UDP-glucuronate 4-epimerase